MDAIDPDEYEAHAREERTVPPMSNPPASPLGDDLRKFARVVPATLRAHAERFAVEADELTEELAQARARND
jgi:hypothetical protein